MKCPECQSDRINYSMVRDSNGILRSYAECQNCHNLWERNNMDKTQSEPKKDSNNTKPKKMMRSPDWIRKKRIAVTAVVSVLWAALLIALAILLPPLGGLLFIVLFLLAIFKTEYFIIALASVPLLVWKMTGPSLPENEQKQKSVTDISQPTFRSDMTGLEYEEFVATRLKIEGYTDVTVTKASGDHGADILAVTQTGITAVIQCKLYKGVVGQEAVQQAVSAREYYHRSQAIVITNSTFTPAAKDFARHTDTILIENYI